MNPDSELKPYFRLDCRCGLFVQVEASGVGEAKMKFRHKGCRVIGEAHNLHWACPRCVAMEEQQHAA